MDDDDTSSEGGSGFDEARAEKEAIYPDDGYVLAEIDMLKPPGEALTPLKTSLKLTDITVPPTTELTDYVVYDAEGHSYTRTSLDDTIADPDAELIDTLCDQARSDDKRTQRHALYGLAELATDHPDLCLDAVPALTDTLESSDPDLRAMALEALTGLADASPDTVTPVADDVVELLDANEDPRVVPDAVEFVATLATRTPSAVIDAAPKLAVLLEDDTQAQSRVIVALKRISETYPDAVVPAASALQDYVTDGDSDQRIAALAVLGMIAKEYPDIAESMIGTTTDLLTVDSDRLRANAAGLLADLADTYPEQIKGVVPEAIELLDDPDKKARHNATSILARIAKTYPEEVTPAIDPLRTSLNDDFTSARANACWALGYLEAEQALEDLETLATSDPSEEVRDAAEFAVSEIRSN